MYWNGSLANPRIHYSAVAIVRVLKREALYTKRQE